MATFCEQNVVFIALWRNWIKKLISIKWTAFSVQVIKFRVIFDYRNSTTFFPFDFFPHYFIERLYECTLYSAYNTHIITTWLHDVWPALLCCSSMTLFMLNKNIQWILYFVNLWFKPTTSHFKDLLISVLNIIWFWPINHNESVIKGYNPFLCSVSLPKTNISRIFSVDFLKEIFLLQLKAIDSSTTRAN